MGGVFFSGSHINYQSQPLAEKRLSNIMGQIVKFLHRKGYYGAVNADVLEDTSRNQYIVDLGFRMPGSYVLGALKTHFWVQRGLTCASLLFKSLLRISRESFIRALRDDLTQGRIVMVITTRCQKGALRIWWLGRKMKVGWSKSCRGSTNSVNSRNLSWC